MLLPQLLKVDVSALDLAGSCLDSAVALCFGPSPPSHLLVSTSSNTITVLDARSGRVVRQVSPGHGWRPGPSPPGSGLGAPGAHGGAALGCLLLPSGCALGRAPPAGGPGCAHLASQQVHSPAAVLWPPRGLCLPGPQRGWPLSAHSRRAGCQAVGLRNAGWPQLPGVCPRRVGRRVEDGLGCPGLTVRKGRASGLGDTATPGVHWPLGASAGRGLHPQPAAAPQRGRRHLPLGHSGSP